MLGPPFLWIFYYIIFIVILSETQGKVTMRIEVIDLGEKMKYVTGVHADLKNKNIVLLYFCYFGYLSPRFWRFYGGQRLTLRFILL